MAFKDIVVLYTMHEGSEQALQSALMLAIAGEAHLTILATAYDLSLPLMAVTPDPDAPALMAGAIKRAQDMAEKTATDLTEKAKALAIKAGVSFDVRTLILDPDTAPRVVAAHARLGDVLIMSHRPDQFKDTQSEIDSALFHSGRPVLLVSETKPLKRVPQRILIAWDNGREAVRAIAEAMPLLKEAKSTTLLTIGAGRKEGFGPLPGADMALHLARHGVTVETRHEKDNVEFPEQILLRIGEQERYDLIIMGAYGHSRLRQWILGGVTQGVLQGMKTPVFMSH